ncbi:UNVERIFIED_CONTAM: hypothetical protein FKN15_035567 [Acipenser sinensis]
MEPNVFLRPFLEVIRSEDTTGPITGLALTSVNKFLSHGLIDSSHDGAAEGIESMADAVTHARFVGTDPASDEVVLMKILQVLRTLLLTPVGAYLTNESVCEIMQSCFRICFEMRLSDLLRKSAEHTLVDMVQLLFSRLPQFKEEGKSFVGTNMKKDVPYSLEIASSNPGYVTANRDREFLEGGAQLAERCLCREGLGQQGNPRLTALQQPVTDRAPVVLQWSRQICAACLGMECAREALANCNACAVPFIEQSTPGMYTFHPSSDSGPSSISSPTTDSGLEISSKTTSKEDLTDLDQGSSTGTTPATSPSVEQGSSKRSETCQPEAQNEGPRVARTQSASVESIPEVLEDRDSLADQSDAASVHDMDYVNPRGVRFTQSTQKEGAALVPYGLPCIRELFRFLISLTNPHDRHNSEVMIHMGLQLLTVGLESAQISNYQSLLGLVKDELCRHLFQLLSVERLNLYAASLRVWFLLLESMRGHLKFQLEQFKKNLKGVNGTKDFDQDMLEDIYNAIKTDEIVMPEEQTGLVKENYMWSVLLHRGANSEGDFLHLPAGSYDHDLFTMTWGPTIAALSYVFDKSMDETIIQKAISGFRKCAMISAHYGMSDVFDNLIISLCKFTTLSSESVETLPTVFGSNAKAQVAAKTMFNLSHRHGDILREGWKNIMDSMLQLFRAELLPKAMVEVSETLHKAMVEVRETLPKAMVEVRETLPKAMVELNETFPKAMVELSDTLPKAMVEVRETLPGTLLTHQHSSTEFPCTPALRLLGQHPSLHRDISNYLSRDTWFVNRIATEQIKQTADGTQVLVFVSPELVRGLQRGESAVLSFVSWLTLSGTEQSGQRGPSTENQEAKQAAVDCIKHCDPEKLITESKFLQLESLQELMKALISVTPDEETYDEEDAAFCLEMLLRIVLENRDRVSCVWQTVRDHLCHLCVHATENCFLVERAVVGLLRLAIRLLRREDISSQVLLSLRLLLMMKPNVLSRVSRDVSYGLHELLKTNAANIHSSDDWYTLFSLLECIGAGVKPPSSLQATTGPDNDTGAQSDSELSSSHLSEVSLDRGYTSDSEIYAEHGKQSRMHRSVTDVDVASSGWLVICAGVLVLMLYSDLLLHGALDCVQVGRDDIDCSKPGTAPINQYSLTLGQDLGLHDTKSLIKCVESLSFIVRDAAHVTPENFQLCVRTIRVFVEASLNGGYKAHEKRSKSHKHEPKSTRFRRKPREKEGGPVRRAKVSSQRLSHSHSDDEEDEGVPASYHTVSLQLLDLMHTLHTRAASIYSSWAEEQCHLEAASRKIEADSRTLWSNCWCPLLQGIAWLCCDARRQVRMQALTYLQRALLVHDLQTLDALEWESCFNKVLFPLLTKLLESISPADVGGMEETRMRACTLLSKVFLQHLSPLLSLPTFAALWLTILDFMDKYMHAGSSDLLLEAIPESLKNMLLVMDTAGIFHSADSRTGYSDLWEITWERIDCFLPRLREELFKQTIIPETDKAQSMVQPSVLPPPPVSTPMKRSPVEVSPAMSQSPLILQPLASPLQVGHPPMSLPIILNPALIEATSPVPLLSTPRDANSEVK